MSECIVCGGTDAFTPLYAGLVRCPRCGFVKADMSLSDDEARAIYAHNYFFDGEYADYLAEQRALEKSFRGQLRTLRRFAPSGALFDIGCAYGFFLNLARQCYDPVAGVDICEEAVEHCRAAFGLDVRCGEFLDLPLEPGAWSTFTCWMTIEHLTQPGEYVRKVAELLPPGGHFALVTGDIEALNPRLAGPRWRLIHPPTHLSYFSKRSLTRLLRRHGLEVVYCRYVGTWRRVDLALHGLLARKHHKLYELLSKNPWREWMFYFNSYDNLYVVARKTG
ncbi:MAG: class I SAM-dependent methyltransferase [Armatimonadetes bacterium]|nr:class I SAM-dependent methyltransferase [Armatimonadota bacterium]